MAETLIVIALIMIMAGLFMNSEMPRRKLTIQREAYILSQNIRTLENNAGNARSITNCNLNNENRSPNLGGFYPFGGYAIMLDINSPNQYILYANCAKYNFGSSIGGFKRTDSADGTFLYNPVSVAQPLPNGNQGSCTPSSDKKCDYFYDQRGAYGYVDELIAKRVFPSSIRIKESGLSAYIETEESNWSWVECEQLIVNFKPTAPDTRILCHRINDDSANYYVAKEGKITITDGENERKVVVNVAGLVAPKADNQ